MDLGFDTIGNATLLCYERGKPILATDPWSTGTPYFGSWSLSHEVPPEQQAAVRDALFVWISHGHPDHLSIDSLRPLKGKQLLLADHVGGRIHHELGRLGYRVTVLRDRVWTRLSNRIRVQTIADYNQDSILLVDLDGTLIVNLNDACECGWGPHRASSGLAVGTSSPSARCIASGGRTACGPRRTVRTCATTTSASTDNPASCCRHSFATTAHATSSMRYGYGRCSQMSVTRASSATTGARS